MSFPDSLGWSAPCKMMFQEHYMSVFCPLFSVLNYSDIQNGDPILHTAPRGPMVSYGQWRLSTSVKLLTFCYVKHSVLSSQKLHLFAPCSVEICGIESSWRTIQSLVTAINKYFLLPTIIKNNRGIHCDENNSRLAPKYHTFLLTSSP